MFIALNAQAQTWTLKDIGVGLIVQDENYAAVLKIVRKEKSWDMMDLYAKGAFAGEYQGNQALAARIQGPPTKDFEDENGFPVWSYKYKVTYPDGSVYEGGPHGFCAPGFATAALTSGFKGPNKYRIDFSIVHRHTKETRHVGAAEFTALYGE